MSDSTKSAEKLVTLTVVSSAGGFAVYLNGLRIAGSKPWGGGRAVFASKVSAQEVKDALDDRGEGLDLSRR